MKRIALIFAVLLLSALGVIAQSQPAPQRVLTTYIPTEGSGWEVRLDVTNPTATELTLNLSAPSGWTSTVVVPPLAARSELIPAAAAPGPVIANGGEGLNMEVFISGAGFSTFLPPPTAQRNTGWSVIGAGEGYYSLAMYADQESTVELIGRCWEGEELWRLPVTLVAGQVWGQEIPYADMVLVTSSVRIYPPELITIRRDGLAVHYGVPLP